jgi:hypothetical protein
MSRPAAANVDVRAWLRDNGYEDVARMIDRLMTRWGKDGRRTRRSWWVTLAGGTDGEPYTVEGIEFPVLASAQRREGKPVTPNALQRRSGERPPPKRETGRWK